MSKVSKTAKASEVRTAPKEKLLLTVEAAIKEIRNLRVSGLAVLNVEYVDKLLEGYDLAAQSVRNANDPARTQSVAELASLLKALAPHDVIEGEFVSAFAIRVLRTLKEENDTLSVEVRDLMSTVKRQEKELAGLGVVPNAQPDIPPVPAGEVGF